MHTWTRGEKIGFWSLVIALVSCLAAVASVPAFNRGEQSMSAQGTTSFTDSTVGATAYVSPDTQAERLQREHAELQQRILEEQRSAGREENLRLHEQRVTLRKTRIEALAHDFERTSMPAYYSISLRNDCQTRSIDVALYYRDLDDKWVVRGWWQVRPNQTITPHAVWTRNGVVYFYGISGTSTWDGASDSTFVRVSIPDNLFYLFADEPNPYDRSNPVVMFRRDLPSTFQPYTQLFYCPSETAATDSAKD